MLSSACIAATCSFLSARSIHQQLTAVSDKPWGGVFEAATDARVEEFTESVSFDRRLYAHDIRGSIAHAQMLAEVGLLTADECEQIDRGPGRRSARRSPPGKFAFQRELEDIHMHIERALIERIGDVGRKLHTGRSRNDQVSTDLRLWVRDAIDAHRRAAGRPAAGVRRPLRRRRRRHPARLHAPAAGPAGAGHPLLAGLLREVRSATASGWPIAAAA